MKGNTEISIKNFKEHILFEATFSAASFYFALLVVLTINQFFKCNL